MPSSTPSHQNVDRRLVLKGAAWALPVVAAATAAPLAAASELPAQEPIQALNPAPPANSLRPLQQNGYVWAHSANASEISISPSSKDSRATFSTQVEYRGTTLPQGATIQLTITFDRDVTIVGSDYQPWQHSSPGRGRVFVFSAPASWAHNLFFNFRGWESGAITAVASMALMNGGSATVAQPTSAADLSYSLVTL